MSFVRGVNPIWWVPDLIGNPMDDTYYLFVLSNTIPYIPLTVYHDSNSSSPWSNPIEMLSNGIVPTDVYWDEDVIYRLEWRSGPSQDYPLTYLIENYSPNDNSGGGPDVNSANNTDNQITNPQFSIVNFTGTLTSSEATITDFAPGWNIVTTGAGPGSISLNQITVSGTSGDSTNPSYALQVLSSGWDTVGIQQVFKQNGALWASETNNVSGVALEISAYNSTGTPPILTGMMTYSGTSTVLTPIFTSILNGSPNTYGGAEVLPVSTNAATPDTANTGVSFYWTSNNTVVVTSVQLIGQQGDNIAELSYQQESVERGVDHTFHYYFPGLKYKSIPSYLVGWDFPLNPCQALGTSLVTGAGTCQYIADQTILYQAVLSNFTVSQNFNGINLTATAASTCALIQYIEAPIAVELLQQRLSSVVQGLTGSGSLSGTVNMYWTNATIPTLPLSVVSSVTAGPITTPAGGWALVPVGNNNKFTLSTAQSSTSVNGFDATAVSGITGATYFAIVISLNTVAASQVFALTRVSLNGGDIPTLPAPQTSVDVLSQCQRYYQKSFVQGTVPVAAAGASSGVEFDFLSAGGYGPAVRYAVPLRITPSIVFYNPITGSNSMLYNFTKSTSALTTVVATSTSSTTTN